jgi:hypothetical protein
MTVQEDWRWCSKCQGLFFGPNSQGACPAGGGHSNNPSGNYVLIDNNPQAVGQPDWRWCRLCQGLFYGKGDGGSCPGQTEFGPHLGDESGNYTLFSEDPNQFGQPDWRWCSKCQGLFYGKSSQGVCRAGGGHDGSQSGKYVLMHYGYNDSRTAFLEIDMMQGTAFPPDSLVFNNVERTLQGIYLQAGISLDIRLDENNIPDLAGTNGTYSDAELHSLMTSHRNSNFQETQSIMSAYMVVVTNYDTAGVLGVMFDSSTRLGCAIFHGHSLINTDNRAFLRTAAHELGHQFNLHHEDGVSFIENGTTRFTIMNQTRIIQESASGWPNGIGFVFGDNERRHLSSHIIKNVKPGGGAFYTCSTEHSSWHSNITISD